MKTILVTGGAGFIGSHTCLLLLKSGYQIYTIDSYINSSPISLERVSKLLNNDNIHENLNIFKGDLRKESDIKFVFDCALKKNEPIEAVIHFAGLKAVGESNQMAIKYWDFNVLSTINLLKIMDKYSCFNLVFSSSATIYKSKTNQLIDENDEIKPINTYGTTKFVIEKMIENVYNSKSNKWRFVNLRYFNPIGAHHSGLIGENPSSQANNLFPQITKVAVGCKKEIMIFGKDWPTIDGTGVRDYIHVMDLAEGHLLALEFLLKEKPQSININLGTGKGTSVLELINTFQKVNNIEIPFVYTTRRKGDNAIVVANNLLAKNLLKWRPKRNIEDMCRDGYLWQIKNPKGYC